MAKSLLSSFANDFNRTISVYPRVETKNGIWEMVMTRPTASATGIKCLLLLGSTRWDYLYWKYINTQIEYIKTTHKIRMDNWPVIQEWDKIKDDNNVWYDIRFVSKAPWFGGIDDHLLVLCDIVR